MQRGAKKREKWKQLNYAFGRHSQHIITQIHSLKWQYFAFFVFCFVESGAEDNAIAHLEMGLALNIACTQVKNFMRKKGSTQVTVRNK